MKSEFPPMKKLPALKLSGAVVIQEKMHIEQPEEREAMILADFRGSIRDG